MGFFGLFETPEANRSASHQRGVSVELLHRTECKSCPLNRADCKSPKQKPVGSSDDCLIYMLGAAPSRAGDKAGAPWRGPGYVFVKNALPAQLLGSVRWNNVIRTYPGAGDPVRSASGDEYSIPRTPNMIEIECCRPSIIRDIEECKPQAIFGFGSVPLRWAANETHPFLWMGRRIPVRIGKHECWYYPFPLPEDVFKDRRWEDHVPDSEWAFGLHLRNACRDVLDGLPTPIIHTKEQAFDGIECITGERGDDDLDRIEYFLFNVTTKFKYVGLDYETNALRPYDNNSKILTAAVSCNAGTISFPFKHRGARWTKPQLQRLEKMWRKYLMLADGPIKCAHQLSFELEWSAVEFGRDIIRASRWGDSISQAYVINETQGLLALENLTMQYFGLNIKELSNVNRKDIDSEPLSNVLRYNGLDAKYHLLLYIQQRKVIKKLGVGNVYKHQLRRVPTLVLTQIEGIPVDQRVVREFRKGYDNEIHDVEKLIKALPEYDKFRRTYGAEYRPSATADLAKMLRMLGHKLSKTEKGGDATDEKNLRQFKDEIVKLTIRHRKASKLLSTYADSITEGIEGSHLKSDGKIHPIISTYKVRTWRTSSEDPNIQNWPKRGPNYVIRRCVAPPPGHKIVAFDYAGIQGRNVAMESRDRGLTKAFIHGYDIHRDWVEKLAKLYPKWAPKSLGTDNKVFKETRSGVKNQFVFPTFFGAQPKSIGVSLGGSGRVAVPTNVVAELQEMFFTEFPDVKKWHIRLNKDYRKRGYVTGLSEFRRHAPVGFNELINAPIQADEAIIVLSAMCELSELDPDKYQPIMEIHDDLTFCWPVKEIDERADVVISEMVRPRFDWINPVPLEVEMSIGDNWADLKEVGKFENVGTDGDYRQLK